MATLLGAMCVVGITGLGARHVGAVLVAPRWKLPHPGLQIAAETGVGLLLLSYALYATVMAGFLLSTPVVTPTLLWGVVGVMGVLGALGLRQQGLPSMPLAVTPGVVAVGAGALIYASWMLLTLILPVNSLDEMVYHLEVPKQILKVGYLPAFTDNVLAYYPMGPQMLFMLGLGTLGETAARLFHALYGVLLLLAVYGYARTLLSRSGAVIAAALVATVPIVMMIGAWAYIDINFTLYGFLALVATLQYIDAREQGEQIAVRWAVLAGLMAGAAWTVKYTGLQLVLLLALLVLFGELRSRTGRLPFGLVAMGGLAFALFVPHLARTWLITGWPLFPFGLGPFELTGAVNWSVEQSELALAWQRQYGAGYDRMLWERLMASIWVYTSSDLDYTSYDGVVGPVFLLAPLALVVRRRAPHVMMLAVFALSYTLYWSLTTTQARFLIPILPVMAILVAVAVSDRFVALCRAAVVFCVAVGLVRAADEVVGETRAIEYWRGDISADQFLTNDLRPYPIYQEANRRLGHGDRLYLVNMRTWGYLLDLPGDGEMWPFPNGWRSDYTFEHYNLQNTLVAARAPADIDQFFGSRGITHVMIDEGITFGKNGLQERERQILADYFRRRGTLLFRNPSDPNQSLWRLSLPSAP